MKKTRVAIIGANGYGGREALRILLNHPRVEVSCLVARRFVGQDIADVLPSFRGMISQRCVDLKIDQIADSCDVALSALPQVESMPVVRDLVGAGVKVVDFSADYRLQDVATYETYYGAEHLASELLGEAVYGLPEIYREAIRKARIVANPGCYPVTVILGLAPLFKAELIESDDIVINSLSSPSGAGAKLSQDYHFPEFAENFKAYGVAAHRHTPEIEQELTKLAGTRVIVSFTPHVVPTARGMLSTISAKLNDTAASAEDLLAVVREYYSHEPFVRVYPPKEYPEPRYVHGSNYCDIGLELDRRTGRVIVISALDNLMKGMAGQAVQCMNLLYGIDETCGLTGTGLCP